MPDLVAAVAEPNRRRLLQLLGQGEQTVTALAGNFRVSRSAVSQHLGVLSEAGLIVSRREGRFQYYRLRPEGMAALRAELAAFWTSELDQLALDARRSSAPTDSGTDDHDTEDNGEAGRDTEGCDLKGGL
jgi:DNA-binding transcriptional ArsR family regulator